MRVLQIGLALHYIKIENLDFAETIVADVLDDLAYFDNQTYLNLMEGLYNRIKFSGPTFWEDTDRGNTNIYYSPDSDKIDDFKKMDIALVDIDEKRLKISHELLDVIAKKLDATPNIKINILIRKEALVGSDFVQSTIQVGGYKPSTVIDFDIPNHIAKYLQPDLQYHLPHIKYMHYYNSLLLHR